MDLNQKKAIDDYQEDIIEVLELIISPFLSNLQIRKVISSKEQEVVNGKPTNEEKLIVLLKLIKTKDSGWNAIISYLKNNNCANLATKLEISATRTVHPTINDADCFTTDFGVKFKKRLANHYMTEYSRVPTVFDCHKPIETVWVPLQLDENTEKFHQQQRFDHFELLRRLAEPRNPHVALVKGHPGVGKTTLVKKIVYDWANELVEQFTLVLALPLRYLGETADFIRSVADYYADRLHLPPDDKTELYNWLNQLGRKLLICLDGLDEYGHLAQSPLVTLFAAPFRSSRTLSCRSPPYSPPYQLLITSRPYACELINRDFFPLRFEICPLDDAHLAEFVSRYCETSNGVTKVTNYLKVNADLVIKVPLILTFVCYLADKREEIPTNLTSLYEKFLSHMAKREILADKVIEPINIENWKESAVVKSSGQLAFHGCKDGKFDFSQSAQKEFGVTNDSFTCGFLLHKFDFGEERLNAEFPHRSIQEFFAALYCSELIVSPEKMERTGIMREILRGDSQFGRFFFGICSDKKKSKEMLDWLNPTFDDLKLIAYDVRHFLYNISAGLSDFSEAELFGEKLATSLDQLEYQITTEREEKIIMEYPNLFTLNKSFQNGLRLNFLGTGRFPSWSLYDANKPKWARLVYLLHQLPTTLLEQYDQIDILTWVWSASDVATQLSSLDGLPPVSTLIAQSNGEVHYEVNFHLEYETKTPHSITPLRHFIIGFYNSDIRDLYKDLSGSDPSSVSDLLIEEQHRTTEKAEVFWMRVREEYTPKLSELVKSLIQLALRAYVLRSQPTKKQKLS